MTMRRFRIRRIERLMIWHAKAMHRALDLGLQSFADFHRREFCRLALRLYKLEAGS